MWKPTIHWSAILNLHPAPGATVFASLVLHKEEIIILCRWISYADMNLYETWLHIRSYFTSAYPNQYDEFFLKYYPRVFNTSDITLQRTMVSHWFTDFKIAGY